MNLDKKDEWVKTLIPGLVMILMISCNLTASPGLAPTPTPTQTGGAPQVVPTSPETGSRCNGLSGGLEIKVLVGPAEAVGLEPFAVGEIPFSVAGEGIVQGAGPVSYHEVLEEEWGSYTVDLDMDALINGQCQGDPGSEELHLMVQMTGEQMVEVRAKGFSGDYPWSGTTTNDLVFPLEDGSSQAGEGWEFILHLD